MTHAPIGISGAWGDLLCDDDQAGIKPSLSITSFFWFNCLEIDMEMTQEIAQKVLDANDEILTIGSEIGVQALIKLGCRGCDWLFLTDAA